MDVDRIECDVLIHTSMAQVWDVLTRPEHVATWFGGRKPVTMDLRPGGMLVFDHGSHGPLLARVVEVAPPRVLSFAMSQSPSGEEPSDGNATLIEFTLTADGAATRLCVVESGFATLKLPTDWALARREQNGVNWPGALARLKASCEEKVG